MKTFILKCYYKLYFLLHPKYPWLMPKAIKFLSKYLTNEMIGIEWGSGKSTIWFCERMKELVSIEFNKTWFDKVNKWISDKNINNISYHYIPIEEKEPPHNIFPSYVDIINNYPDNYFDFILIDGHYRPRCVQASIPHLKTGGIMFIDNSNWLKLEKWGVPATWEIVLNIQKDFAGFTIWQKK